MTPHPIPPDTSPQAKYRAALLAFAAGRRYSHWATLNTHASLSPNQAKRMLQRWRVEVFRRLHGRRFFDLPESDLTYYVGCIEDSGSGHPHFHLVCAVPADLGETFRQVAEQRWLAIARCGTFHCEPVGVEPDAWRDRLGYATKQMYRGAEVPFIDSRMYT